MQIYVPINWFCTAFLMVGTTFSFLRSQCIPSHTAPNQTHTSYSEQQSHNREPPALRQPVSSILSMGLTDWSSGPYTIECPSKRPAPPFLPASFIFFCSRRPGLLAHTPCIPKPDGIHGTATPVTTHPVWWS